MAIDLIKSKYRPAVPALRTLPLIWLLDCSGSMAGENIQLINHVMTTLGEVGKSYPGLRLLIQVLVFSDGARWHIAEPTPLEDLKWQALSVGGFTDMGQALLLLARYLETQPLVSEALPPLLLLVSDGQPTDDFTAGLTALMAVPIGQAATRVAIALGAEEGEDDDVLQQFIGVADRKPHAAEVAEQVAGCLKGVLNRVLTTVPA